MKKTLLIALGLAFATAGAVAAPEDSLTKAGCNACHTKDKKLVGPSYKEIATKYKGQAVQAQLMDKVRKGGSGSFGPIPMAPNPPNKISDAELKEVVDWILKQS